MACRPKKDLRTTQAEKTHLKGAGFENGAYFVREIRQNLPDQISVGQKVAIDSLEKGSLIKATAKSKGRGFASTIKRWNFGGGRASHGGKATLRAPGSIGMCEFPGRVIAGKKMSGHYGQETTSVKNLKVVDVIPEESVILVKGPIPGARNTLVRLEKA
ncbi:MAG: 50S ribosomal protein L3 [Bdellovibrionales bacterium]